MTRRRPLRPAATASRSRQGEIGGNGEVVASRIFENRRKPAVYGATSRGALDHPRAARGSSLGSKTKYLDVTERIRPESRF